jgi:hypothetical protein
MIATKSQGESVSMTPSKKMHKAMTTFLKYFPEAF